MISKAMILPELLDGSWMLAPAAISYQAMNIAPAITISMLSSQHDRGGFYSAPSLSTDASTVGI